MFREEQIDKWPKAAQVLWRLKWVFVGLVAAAVVAIISVALVNDSVRRKEVRTWKVSPWRVTHCPVPFGLEDKLSGVRGFGDVVSGEMKYLNEKVAPRLGWNRKLFVPVGQQPGGNAVFTVRPSKPGERDEMQDRCWNPGNTPQAPPGEVPMSFFHFHIDRMTARLVDSPIVFCHKKYAFYKGLAVKPKWMSLKDRGWYLRHELMHTLMGAEHPKALGDSTGAGGGWGVSASTVKILKRLYDPVCLPKGAAR